MIGTILQLLEKNISKVAHKIDNTVKWTLLKRPYSLHHISLILCLCHTKYQSLTVFHHEKNTFLINSSIYQVIIFFDGLLRPKGHK
jgi:hypothetical protein